MELKCVVFGTFVLQHCSHSRPNAQASPQLHEGFGMMRPNLEASNFLALRRARLAPGCTLVSVLALGNMILIAEKPDLGRLGLSHFES